MCLAPATRIGYVVYPVNLLVWSWLLDPRTEAPAAVGVPDGAVEPATLPRTAG